MAAIPARERITGARREKLAAQLAVKYRAGVTLRDLMVETGRSYGFVHRLLTDHGVVLRSRGGSIHRSVSR